LSLPEGYTKKVSSRDICHVKKAYGRVFFKTELKFLGHIVPADGMSSDPAKVAAVAGWPTAINAYEVRAFLGLANYFRKHIRAFLSAIAAPLTDLLQGIDKQDQKGKNFALQSTATRLSKASHGGIRSQTDSKVCTGLSSCQAGLITAPILSCVDSV
jgi:hypothetical protein